MKFYLPIFIFLAVGSCQTPMPADAQIPEAICRHWIHSFEEDTVGVRIFRPADFPFPPARGREGFEIFSDGRFIHHPIGHADEWVSLHGSWQMTTSNLCRIIIKGQPPLEMEILESGSDKLVVKN